MPKAQDDDLVMSLADLARSQPPDARESWLRSACGGDAELFGLVREYVEWNDRMQDFLLEPLCAPLPEHRFQRGDLLLQRFRIAGELGEGGMGIVYEAHDEKLGRRIALKCAKSGFSNRLPPEVRHASEISHPHVCRIFEIHTASTPRGEVDFLTMEFLDGETLALALLRPPRKSWRTGGLLPAALPLLAPRSEALAPQSTTRTLWPPNRGWTGGFLPTLPSTTRKLWSPNRGWMGGFLRFLAPRRAALALPGTTRKLWPPNRGWMGGFLRLLAPRRAALALLGQSPLGDAEVRTIGRQICAGLAEAHRNGVIHGDLKCNNVILCRDSRGEARAVITDFGLARMPLGWTDEGMAAGQAASRVAGTPDYMAPELWKGESPSAASDVYALGVVLYELVANHRPWAHDIPWQDRVKQRPAAVRHPWDPILQRCLEADPARRYRDAGEVAAALEPSRALRWWMAAAAALALAALTGLVTYTRDTAPEESIRLALLPLEAKPDTADLAAAMSRDAAADLGRLKGGKRARLSAIPADDVARRHVDSSAMARSELGATHVVSGTLAREEGRVVVQVFLTDTRNQTRLGDWKAEYTPAEIRYAAAAITGMVTASLRLPPLATPSMNAKARPDYLAGLEFMRRNSTIDKALQLFARAAEADPDSPLTWAGLAEAQYVKYFMTKDTGWLDRSAESLRQAQERNLDMAPVHRIAGVLRYNAGMYHQAEQEYQRAIELDPGDAENYRRLGQANDRDNRISQSLEAYRKATQLDGNYGRAWNGLGSFYWNHGNYTEAARQFEKEVRLEPGEADGHFALGTVYSNLRRYPEAERELRLAIAIRETPPALNNLADALTSEGKDAEAIPILVRAVSLSPGQSLRWMNLGNAYRRTSRRAEAAKAYVQAEELAQKELTRDPHDGTLRTRLAYLCARLGDRERAESELGQALHDAPDDTRALGRAVVVNEALGQRQRALDILNTLPEEVFMDISLDPDLADLRKDSRFQELLGLHHLR